MTRDAPALRALVEIDRIQRVKRRYLQAVDDKDYETIAAVFTHDAVVDFSRELQHHVGHHGVTLADVEPELWNVIGGLRASDVVRSSVDGLVTVHHGHDPQIELIGDDQARGRWSLHDILVFEHETMHGYGYYLEEYRRVDGNWLISSLELHRRLVTWQVNSVE